MSAAITTTRTAALAFLPAPALAFLSVIPEGDLRLSSSTTSMRPARAAATSWSVYRLRPVLPAVGTDFDRDQRKRHPKGYTPHEVGKKEQP